MRNPTLRPVKDVEWETPQAVFDKLDAEFGFTLDAAASEENHKCARYYTKAENGLRQSWQGERVFLNPPYGRELAAWVEKAFDEVYRRWCPLVVMLLPARVDTQWFHRYLYHRAEVRFVEGRLKFGNTNTNAPFASMIAILRNPRIGG